MSSFSFLTNHGAVLLCIAEDPQIRIRDIAAKVGITERATQRVVSDLIDSGYVARTREGRRNSYAVSLDLAVKLPNQRDVELNALLSVLLSDPADAERGDAKLRAPVPEPAAG